MENGAGKSSKVKPFRPATRSTRKINEYFARLPANGIIRVQNGHGSHSEDSCDSFEDQPSSTENDPPAKPTEQKMTNGPMLLPEAQATNANLFLQEPVLKLQFDKSEVVSNVSPIKSSFLTTEITNKFQTLPPTEYINKVLNVNGSHDDDVAASRDQHAFLLNSDSNSSDSGVVIGDEFLKSPLQLSTRRRKPTTPHRMILCSSPIKESTAPPRNDVELIKPGRSKNRNKVK